MIFHQARSGEDADLAPSADQPYRRLSITRQAELLALSRASRYYKAEETRDAELKLISGLNELHKQWQVLSSRP